jgi:hypothetical protein
MDGTPQPIVPDFVAALRQHMLQEAPDELVGRQGHGSPALVLGVLIAEAHLAVLDGEQAGVGQRDPVDLPAQGVQDWLRALHGRLTVDAPPFGPDRLGTGQVGACLTHQLEKPPGKSCARAWTGTQEDVRAGRHAVRSAETPPAGTGPCPCG